MRNRLQNLKIAVLATDGFEESELLEPVAAFREEGAEVTIVSPKAGTIKSWKEKNWGMDLPVDLTLNQANPDDFDALHLPGGVINPDRLRLEPKAVAFVKAFTEQGKTVSAICHGPWMLIEAEAVRGRKIASWPSLKTDLQNAGAEWTDLPAVADGNLITSRKPDDIPIFNAKVIETLEKTLAPTVG
jgi:protease I